MNILTYNCLGDIHTYSMTCKDEWLDMYIQMLFENDVYKVILNNRVKFTSYADYEKWKNVNE